MDGSLEPFYPYWDETFNSNAIAMSFTAGPGSAHLGAGVAARQNEMDPAGVGLPNDLWMAMTMNWAHVLLQVARDNHRRDD